MEGAALSPAAARRARQGLRALIEGESADLPERQSLRWMWNELEYEGGFFGDLPSGGYRSLVQAMAAGLDVRLNFDVAGIAVEPGGVNVRSAAGPAEDGSHVVVTVPLGVLKVRRLHGVAGCSARLRTRQLIGSAGCSPKRSAHHARSRPPSR